MNTGLLLVFLIIVGFGGWPLLASPSGANQFWKGFYVMFVTGLVPAVYYHRTAVELPNLKGFGLLTLGALLNGVAIIAYNKIFADPQYGTKYIAVAMVGMLALLTIGGGLVLNEPLPWTKFVGLALACTGIWFMMK